MLENHVGSIATLQITFRKAKEQLFHVLWPENITHHETTNIRWYKESNTSRTRRDVLMLKDCIMTSTRLFPYS